MAFAFHPVRSRAPLRLGLAGGGTDLSPFSDEYGGMVLNCTIDRYAYAFLEPRGDGALVFRARDLGREESFASPGEAGMPRCCCIAGCTVASCVISTAGG